jgi:hypothetical protein
MGRRLPGGADAGDGNCLRLALQGVKGVEKAEESGTRCMADSLPDAGVLQAAAVVQSVEEQPGLRLDEAGHDGVVALAEDFSNSIGDGAAFEVAGDLVSV